MGFVNQFIICAATVNPRNNNCRYNSGEHCVKLWPIRHIGMDSSCISPDLHWLSDCLCSTQRFFRAEECCLGSARILHDLFRCLWCRPNDGAAVCLSLKAVLWHLNVVLKLIFLGQSIIFRAFQGIGGSGIYSMVMVAIPEIAPLPKLGLATGGIGAMYAASSILGPTIGGSIVSRTTWRWVFLLKFVWPT
jgi:Major Facilitator Superfamily